MSRPFDYLNDEELVAHANRFVTFDKQDTPHKDRSLLMDLIQDYYKLVRGERKGIYESKEELMDRIARALQTAQTARSRCQAS